MNDQVIGEVALVMSEIDNVATALADLTAGQELAAGDVTADGGTVTLMEDIPFGHKVALRATAGADVYEHGEVIGEVSTDIAAGEWVHTHNCDSKRGRSDLTEGER